MLPHAERVGADAAPPLGPAEPDPVEHLVRPPGRQAHHERGQGERLAAAAPGVLGGRVEQDADPQARVGQLGVRAAEHGGASGTLAGQPDQDPQRGGLARPVRPEEAGNRARANHEGHVVDHLLAAVELAEPGDLDRSGR
jgi:hypothetical protein